MRKSNRWHKAIIEHLATIRGPQTPEQIWSAIEKAGFHHGSESPRSTLGARIAELVRDGVIQRVSKGLYVVSPARMG